jgi:hypothetical protein
MVQRICYEDDDVKVIMRGKVPSSRENGAYRRSVSRHHTCWNAAGEVCESCDISGDQQIGVHS